MLALVGYPFLIEPAIGTKQQALAWSIGFGASRCSLQRVRGGAESAGALHHACGLSAEAPDAPAPTKRQKLAWIVFAALGSMLLLAVSNPPHAEHLPRFRCCGRCRWRCI